jgi:transcriptional regulator with XRE-family HTH domain
MRTLILIVNGVFVNFDSLCAARLKSERTRLSLKQNELASMCGISREMWGKYERGIAVPGGDVLVSFAQAGADIQYILTGEKSGGVALSRDESELVQHYRKAPLVVKAAALAALTAGGSNERAEQIFHGSVGQVIKGDATYEKGVTFNVGGKKKQ